MTHSHDRTLLARLGFQDPDLKEPVHDLACEYIALEENARALRDFIRPIDKEHQNSCVNGRGWISDGESYGQFERHAEDIKFFIQRNIECPLTKGLDQYKTTIGFVDVMILWESEIRAIGTFTGDGAGTTPIQVDGWIDGPCGQIAIEVKIRQISLGDLVRQMHLYREYLPSKTKFVVAVAFTVDEYYRDALSRENIILIRLGDKFHAWGASRLNAKQAQVREF